jgi:hypothetical protein
MDDTGERPPPDRPLSTEPAHSLARDFALTAVVGLVAALAGWADLRWGGMAAPAHEELLNARGALMVACGHVDALWALQYRAFCGGCSADALVGAPILRSLGATVFAWKLVPLLFHGAAAGAVTLLARRAAGLRGALIAAALILGAPAAWRELVLTGWGNHAESAAFTFGAAALLLGSRRIGLAVLAGLLTGLGVWYAWISAHAVPALLVGAFLAGGWRGLTAFTLSIPLGLAPLLLHHGPRPSAQAETLGALANLDLAGPSALWRWTVEPLLPGRSWPQGDGWLSVAGSAAAAALGGLGLLGAGLGLRQARQARPLSSAGLVLPALGLLGLGLAFALRHDLWSDTPAVMGFDPFNLRYRAPILPLLLLGAGLAAGRWRGAAVLAGVVAAFGWAQRVSAWDLDRPNVLATNLDLSGLPSDPTVPEGEPPRRNVEKMDRVQDISAAVMFMVEHEDPLPACVAQHEQEMGRRSGLAMARRGEAPVVVGDRAWAQGLVGGLQRGGDDGSALDRISDPIVAEVWGRSDHARGDARSDDPARAHGWCLARGASLVQAGRDPSTLAAERAPCEAPLDVSFDEGVGEGIGRWWGCEDTVATTGLSPDAVERGRAEGCARWRPHD